mmetsp:Transcript_8639/g.17708  ORF Transcript_8639/g.17708 Transcript_8639/m.17708 type:complete len:86 (+) Transcript_8639:1700-1957(+)
MDPTREDNLPMRIPPVLPKSEMGKVQDLYTVSSTAFSGLDWARFMEPFLWTCTAHYSCNPLLSTDVSKFGMSNPMVAKMTKASND